MKEDFLHFVWKTLSFEPRGLETREGEPVHIYQTGIHNHDQGPDFSEGKIGIGPMIFSGQVELHLESGDWYRHKHDRDPTYNNVILHVVYETTGQPIIREDGTAIPEICLKGRIPEIVSRRYYTLELSQESIPCSGSLPDLHPFLIQAWLTRMGITRIQEKGDLLREKLRMAIMDWEQSTWEQLAYAFGGPVNGRAFREVAERVRVQVLRKHIRQRREAEGILLGAAGLLTGFRPGTEYEQEVCQHWLFSAQKYGLEVCHEPIKYSRMRPASFPGIRISQLITVLEIFPSLTELLSPEGMEKFREQPLSTSGYWKTHFRLGVEGKPGSREAGKNFRERVIINTLIPLSWLYFHAHGRPDADRMITRQMETIPPESNKITRLFADLNVKPENALESQGMIQLKKTFCDQKRCLECGIGFQILSSDQKGVESG